MRGARSILALVVTEYEMSEDKGQRDSLGNAGQRGDCLKLDLGRRSFNLRERAASPAPLPNPDTSAKKLPPQPGRIPSGTTVPTGEVLNPQQRRN
jgi:hypothetical protein